MASLDFKSPFDELTELRAVLTTQEIAELTGLRRETISRARPDSRFQRRTEEALRDLYLVVTRMQAVIGDDLGQLAAILRRPQAELAERSIAELLRDGQVDAVLASLSSEAPTKATEDVRKPTVEERVATLLDGDPELRSRLPAIEAALLRGFGPGATVERKIVNEVWDDLDGSDELHVRVHNDLSLDENIDRQADFLAQERDLLAPVRSRLSIGFIG
ncbi:MAG: hypothetical protein ACRDPE_11395 [Solirubrobacterales bacterium]